MEESKEQDIARKRTIRFEWEGTEYVIEFNRASVELLERKFGMNVMKMLSEGEARLTDLPVLFQVGLMMHHPNMKKSTAEGILSLVSGKDELYGELMRLVALAANDIFVEPDEGKAISWSLS